MQHFSSSLSHHHHSYDDDYHNDDDIIIIINRYGSIFLARNFVLPLEKDFVWTFSLANCCSPSFINCDCNWWWKLRILPQQNTALLSHFRLSVRRRDMSIYANIYTDFEHWFQYICSHDLTRPDHYGDDYDDDNDHLATTWRPHGDHLATTIRGATCICDAFFLRFIWRSVGMVSWVMALSKFSASGNTVVTFILCIPDCLNTSWSFWG